MIGVLLEHAEDAYGRLASLLAAGNGRLSHQPAGVIDCDPLTAERDDGHDRLPAGTPVDGFDRPFVPGACGAGTIACRDRRRQPHNGEPCGPRPDSFVLRIEITGRHASPELARQSA